VSKLLYTTEAYTILRQYMVEPFERLFGDTSELRVIESLLPKRERDFNITEIAEESDISRQAAIPVVRKFLEWDLLKIDSKRGNANYYKVNEDSDFIKAFREINGSLIEKVMGRSPAELSQHALSPCIPATSPIEVTVKNYITGAELNEQETKWIKVDSIEFSWVNRIDAQKNTANRGEVYANAA